MKNYKFVVFGSNSEVYTKALELRYKILREPLKLEFTEFELEKDKYDTHMALMEGSDVLACLTLTDLLPEGYKMRQVAVSGEYQKMGLGKKMNLFAENWMREKGVSKVFCNARENAVPFYEKMGYEVKGDRFLEVGIPHFYMEKRLK